MGPDMGTELKSSSSKGFKLEFKLFPFLKLLKLFPICQDCQDRVCERDLVSSIQKVTSRNILSVTEVIVPATKPVNSRTNIRAPSSINQVSEKRRRRHHLVVTAGGGCVATKCVIYHKKILKNCCSFFRQRDESSRRGLSLGSWLIVRLMSVNLRCWVHCHLL